MTEPMYVVRVGRHDAMPAAKWLNAPVPEDQMLPPGHIPDRGNQADGYGSGFFAMEKPLLEFSSRHGKLPVQDVEPSRRKFWLVSDRCKSVLEDIDSDAFEFIEVDVVEKVGRESRPGPKYWLCDIVRFLDALDEKQSACEVIIHPGGIKRVRITRRDGEVFDRSLVGAAQIFRAFASPSRTYATVHFRSAIEAAGLTGFEFDTGGRMP